MCFSDCCLSYPYLKHTNQGLHVSLHSSLPEAIHKPNHPSGHTKFKKSNPELQTTRLFNGCWLKQAFLLMDVGLNKCFCWWMLASTSMFVKGSLIKQRFFISVKIWNHHLTGTTKKKKVVVWGTYPKVRTSFSFSNWLQESCSSWNRLRKSANSCCKSARCFCRVSTVVRLDVPFIGESCDRVGCGKGGHCHEYLRSRMVVFHGGESHGRSRKNITLKQLQATWVPWVLPEQTPTVPSVVFPGRTRVQVLHQATVTSPLRRRECGPWYRQPLP